jgi:hypothetical protein
MELTLEQLQRLPIKRLKEILKKLDKEPESEQNEATKQVIKLIIKKKKEGGLITHPEFLKHEGMVVRAKKCTPVHLVAR